MPASLKNKLLASLLLALLILIGVVLRVNGRFTDLMSSNVRAFYFQRSAELVSTGVFPATDKWGFAPKLMPENTPPALGYISWLGFSLWKAAGAGDSFREFADKFPVGIFILWAFLTYFLLMKLTGNNRFVAFGMVFLLVFADASVSVTGWGKYFEETIGVPALVFAAIAFAYMRRFDWLFWVGSAALTILVLGWQLFPIFYAAAIAVIAGNLIFRHRERILPQTVLLVAAVAIGEFAVRLVVHNGYSPLAMFGELFTGFMHRNEPDFVLALSRNDWSNVDIAGFWKYYGPLGVILGVFGMAVAAKWFRDDLKRAAAIFGVMGILIVGEFTKMRHLGLGLFALPWILGLQFIEGATHVTLRSDFYRSALEFLKKWWKHWRPVLGLGIMLITVGVGLAALWYYRVPVPRGEIVIDEKDLGSGRTELIITLKNRGGNTSWIPPAFAGLHVELTGANILESSLVNAPEGSDLGTKSYAQWGKFYFFETKFPRIYSGGEAGVKLLIQKTGTGLEAPLLYVRGWLPKFQCSIAARKEGIKDLLPSWQSLKDGWRNEKCIVRIPANDDESSPACAVRVFAAHQKPQTFRCLEKSL